MEAEKTQPSDPPALGRARVLAECFDSLDLRAPAHPECTRTIGRLTHLDATKDVLEVGAGTGRCGLQLAREFGCRVTITDIDTAALKVAQRRAEAEGLDKRVVVRPADLRQLEFPHASFDLAVGEGSLYVLGFEEAVKELRRIIRLGGYLAATHLTWIKSPVPERVLAFWRREYDKPIRTAEENLRLMDRAGYEPVHHEVLPPAAWDAYYQPLQANLERLRARHAADPEALRHLQAVADELDCHYQWGGRDSAGYVLYIARKMLC